MSCKIFMEKHPNKYRREIPTGFDRNQHNKYDFCLKQIRKGAVGIDRQSSASFSYPHINFKQKMGVTFVTYKQSRPILPE